MPLKVPSALCCMNETVKYRRGGAFLEREKRREREWNENQLEGRNAVLEVLRSGRDIEKIMVQKGNVEGTIKRIVAQAAEKGVVIQEVSRQKLDELSQYLYQKETITGDEFMAILEEKDSSKN